MEWRKVPNYPAYEISNTGEVRRADNHLPLYPTPNAGRMRVAVTIAPYKTKQLGVARLVWEAFNGAIPPNMHIFHLDGNYENNTLENLYMEKRGYK